MEHFSYSGGCGMMHIETCKEELAWAIDKPLQVIIINIMLLKTVIALRN